MTDRNWMPPQLATLADAAPAGEDWIHEVKFDGYRLLAWIDGPRIRLLTRNRKDWTERFADVVDALRRLDVRDSVWDGEVAVELEDGSTSFQALQNSMRSRTGSLRFYLFDVLRHAGSDVRDRPLLERKALLQKALPVEDRVLRYSDHVTGNGPAFHRQACRHGLEGIISKRAAAPYRGGRGGAWLKVKCVLEQEFVVGGFTEPAGSRAGLGALYVGVPDGGRLDYRGKVGTGFSDAVLRDLRRRLGGLEQPETPFRDGPRGAAARTAHWVKPVLVAQIRYTDLTDDGRLRHPVFLGLREDKEAEEVEMEESKAAGRGAMEIRGVRLTSPNRVLYPEQGLTKLDLARYYEAISPWLLPHAAGRPLTLVRCPAGREGKCFFQKHMDDSSPAELGRVLVEERDGAEWYGVVDSAEGLIALAQIGALEIHTSNARADRLDRPDRFVIDLDPDESLGWDTVVEAAIHVRELLAELGLASFVKTTGGKGLHVVVPLVRRSDWDDVMGFSRAVASLLARAAPDRYTLDSAKRKRTGRILLDYLRNARGATAVEAYSPRARPGAPVATPIGWAELEAGVRGDAFSVATLPERLGAIAGDPWKDYGAVRQSLTARMKKRLGL